MNAQKIDMTSIEIKVKERQLQEDNGYKILEKRGIVRNYCYGMSVWPIVSAMTDFANTCWIKTNVRTPIKKGYYCIRKRLNKRWRYTDAFWDGTKFIRTELKRFEWFDQGENNCL